MESLGLQLAHNEKSIAPYFEVPQLPGFNIINLQDNPQSLGNEQLDNSDEMFKIEDIDKIRNVSTSESRRGTMENNHQGGNNNAGDTFDTN